MALFQPTNIIPSSFTVGVVDTDKDMAQVSWQVNGNSAMTAFEIEFQQNNTDSTVIASTGKQPVAGGFFGIDRFGQPKMFTWTASNNQTWDAFNANFTNGKQFKFKITQYWMEGGVEKSIEQIESSVFITRDAPTCNIQRSVDENFTGTTPFPSGSTLPASIGYFVGAYSQAQGAPVREVRWQVATWINGALGEILADTGDIDTPTLQFEFNGFFIGNEYAVRCSGKADYQTYGTQDFDSGWVNFTAQLADGQKQSDYTGNFTVECLSKENAALLQWESVEVIPPSFSPNDFNPMPSNGSVTLPAKSGEAEYSITWNKQSQNPMSFSAPWTAVWKGQANNILYFDKIANGYFRNNNSAIFSPDGKILVSDRQIFSVDGTTITYVSNISTSGYGIVEQIAFSPDGKTLVLIGGQVGGEAFSAGAIYTVNGTNITFAANIIYRNGSTFLPERFSSVEFSPDGKLLIIGAVQNFRTSYYCIYSVDGTTITYVSDITPGSKAFSNFVESIAFSPDGKTLVLENKVFSVDGTTITYVSDITKNGVELGNIYIARFSPDGKTLVLGGDTRSQTAVFSVDGTTITYVSDITKNGVELGEVASATFSPDGKVLVLVGNDELIDGRLTTNTVFASSFLVSGTEITYISEITSNYPPVSISNGSSFTTAAFSPDGKVLVLGPVEDSNELATFTMFKPLGKVLTIQSGSELITVSIENLQITVTSNNGDRVLGRLNISLTKETAYFKTAIILTPVALLAYVDGQLQDSVQIDYSQSSLKSVSIYGGEEGNIVDSVSVYQGDGSNILSLYQNADFEPVWNDSQYDLYMTANFNGNLEGGTGTASGNGFRIYRQEVGSNILTPIANTNSTETSLKDYGIRSRKAYKYSLYAYDINGAFMTSVENDTVISTCFNNYSLLVCDYDSKKDAYHVRKQYLFALNLSVGSEGNNNSPTLNKNFTPYPTRMADTANYISGTLQGLIGAIYTVPALVEQISGFKHMSKPSTLDYFDSVDLEQELYELSTAPYQLFLRDMKGHLRMVTTNNQIGMTHDLKKRQIPLTISFPWVEIGDASDVTIIQTPEDYGWNNDGQVLDVRLDVDPTTGVLSATYPKPYTGTKFYLTGVNKEILGAKTPLGVTPAQFALSEKTNEPDDGILSATAKVNTEEGD